MAQYHKLHYIKDFGSFNMNVKDVRKEMAASMLPQLGYSTSNGIISIVLPPIIWVSSTIWLVSIRKPSMIKVWSVVDILNIICVLTNK